ncbi:acylphosphatase-2-like isoform X2 [Photinus pyralis]|nr:acylphosphatase-2-like isoform X2 [Photinus pyralis]
MSAKKLLSVEFEVFGRVQGVFFRKFTQQEAKKLGLKGWCMNTESGTVQGVMEGNDDKINEMKKWLETIGSPLSKIEKTDFRNQKEITELTFSNFSVKR